MLKKLFFLSLCCLFASILTAQAIEKQKAMGGYKYLQGGKKLSLNELGKILQSDAAAYPIFQSGKSQNGLGAVIGAIGGALVGWPIGTGATKKINRAVDMYNGKLGTGMVQKPQMSLVAGASRLGFAWRF